MRVWTGSQFDHAVLYLGSGVLVQATVRGVKLGQLDQYAGRLACANSAESITEEQRTAICAKAAGFVGREYGWTDLILIAFRRLDIRWRWLVARLQDRDALICSQLVAEAGEAGYLDWLCDQGNPALVTPAMLANRPGVQPVAWPKG